jgi:hypothetical protein
MESHKSIKEGASPVRRHANNDGTTEVPGYGTGNKSPTTWDEDHMKRSSEVKGII